MDNYCNNCGKQGHLYHQCKLPITSNGIIAFRKNKSDALEYLMICRKDSLGYIDLIRGKYDVYNHEYILSMINQMSIMEKVNILKHDFNFLWTNVWNMTHNNKKYKNEYINSFEKFNKLKQGYIDKTTKEYVSFATLIKKSYTRWIHPEWGFPKGRRNFQENDYNCAMREFCEETGYEPTMLNNISNIMPSEEIFTGSNYKSYKHKYFLAYVDYNISTETYNHQQSEVSQVKWLTYDEAISHIRDYNLEKKNILTNLNTFLKTYRLFEM
jgi:8-oxo-dGTP pyrophosphatase MutT (NUDIX family)